MAPVTSEPGDMPAQRSSLSSSTCSPLTKPKRFSQPSRRSRISRDWMMSAGTNPTWRLHRPLRLGHDHGYTAMDGHSPQHRDHAHDDSYDGVNARLAV